MAKFDRFDSEPRSATNTNINKLQQSKIIAI